MDTDASQVIRESTKAIMDHAERRETVVYDWLSLMRTAGSSKCHPGVGAAHALDW
jgi:hypothetical protein